MKPSKERALAALLTHSTRKEAAAAAGISDRTLRTYFNDPEFVQEYKAAFGGLVEDATRQAQQVINPALSTLKEIMLNTEESASVRIQAARATIEYALRLTEQIDILEQLRELERANDDET